MKTELSCREYLFLEQFLREKVIVTLVSKKPDCVILDINDDVALAIRDLLGDEIANYFDSNDSPTDSAFLIESLIDKLFPPDPIT